MVGDGGTLGYLAERLAEGRRQRALEAVVTGPAVSRRHRGHVVVQPKPKPAFVPKGEMDEPATWEERAGVYLDGTPAATEERPCPACGLCAESFHAPDPCLGWLPGLWSACCGHGSLEEAHVMQDTDPLCRRPRFGREAVDEFARFGITVPGAESWSKAP